MNWLKKLFGDTNVQLLAVIGKPLAQINEFEGFMSGLSDEELKAQTTELKNQLAAGKTLDDILPQAFATVRETAKRVLGQRHYDVQLLGGVALHKGYIAEMATGEGKTLTSTLAIYLNALAGKGVHVVAPNDYLSRRDAAWMGRVFHALGLSIGVVQSQHVSYVFDIDARAEVADDAETVKTDLEHDHSEGTVASFKIDMDNLRSCTRAAAYACDITYGTNNEFGFDYLRDNMVVALHQKVQRGLYYAVVDEIDSILIDEARTPLIISAPAEEPTQMYYTVARVVAGLQKETDYVIDEKLRSAVLTQEGIEKVEQAMGISSLYEQASVKLIHHIENALKAESLFKRDKHYVVVGEEIVIVDEFTGRMMQGRRYSEGLHQAIEAKENVPVQRESETLATITFQNYFRMYAKLSGMTGTAATEAEEFVKIYGLDVVSIPTHRPLTRDDRGDLVYGSEKAKFAALIAEVKERREKGQPVLIGTASIQKNELVSMLLHEAGVPHEVLNAKNHEREAAIIAQAGRRGAVTVATNMAGRGVDIVLGGNPPNKEEAAAVRELGGLCVIGTERHESRRIDNQLRGRSGRQGDIGVSQFYLSLEDDLMRIFGSDRMKGMLSRLNFPEDMPIQNGLVNKSIETAQKRVESHNFDIRKHLLEYDDVLNRHRQAIYGKRNRALQLHAQKDEAARIELEGIFFAHVERELERMVTLHTLPAGEQGWNADALLNALSSVVYVDDAMQNELRALRVTAWGKEEAMRERTELVARLLVLVKNQFASIVEKLGGADESIGLLTNVMIRAIDMLWVEHLVAIERLRTSISLQGYGQRDPLIEYKKQAYDLFNQLLDAVEQEIVHTTLRAGSATIEARSLIERTGVTLEGVAQTGDNGTEKVLEGEIVGEEKKDDVGRNEQCPCGSGKKYKACHGK